jgi:hypothetical protein
MPRRVRGSRRLPPGGYREHRLAVWGVTGCVAVAAGLALTAGLAAASPQLGTGPGTSGRRPPLAGLPTGRATRDPLAPGPSASPSGRISITPSR